MFVTKFIVMARSLIAETPLLLTNPPHAIIDGFKSWDWHLNQHNLVTISDPLFSTPQSYTLHLLLAPQTTSTPETKHTMASVFQAGYTAVITGGASGIGLALAKKCASHGMKVLISDINDQALSSAASSVGGSSSISTIRADVSSLDDWARLKAKVQSDLGGKVNLLALNAGRSVQSGWDDPEAFHKTLDTNLYGVVNGIATLLPTVRDTAAAGGGGRAAIVITGSKQGITNPPGNPAYNASKAAVKTVAEHLSWDLRGTPEVGVHLLVPGWTFTGLTAASGKKEKPEGAWWPEQVVDYLEKKMGEGKFYVICPDNDVSEETDKKRMLWSVGDMVQGRPPLTRWRDEFKEEAKEWMDQQQV